MGRGLHIDRSRSKCFPYAVPLSPRTAAYSYSYGSLKRAQQPANWTTEALRFKNGRNAGSIVRTAHASSWCG